MNREKRLEQEVAYHSHLELKCVYGYVIPPYDMWFVFQSDFTEKNPFIEQSFIFLHEVQVLTEVGCIRGKSQHFPVKNLKKS